MSSPPSNDQPTFNCLAQERIAEEGSSGPAAVKGTLHHSLIQAALSEGLRNPAALRAKAEEIVGGAGEALLDAGLTEGQVLDYLCGEIPGLLRWAEGRVGGRAGGWVGGDRGGVGWVAWTSQLHQMGPAALPSHTRLCVPCLPACCRWMARFVRATPSPEAACSAGYDERNAEVVRRVAVADVVDIEESIWSTKYGVKGMIDVSARLVLEAPVPKQQQRGGGGGGAWMQAAAVGGEGGDGGAAGSRVEDMAPVEIKTGKPHAEHRAQVGDWGRAACVLGAALGKVGAAGAIACMRFGTRHRLLALHPALPSSMPDSPRQCSSQCPPAHLRGFVLLCCLLLTSPPPPPSRCCCTCC